MALISNAQLSERVDKAVYFKSIQFGQAMPADFLKSCKTVSDFTNPLQVIYDSLGDECKTRYADLFNFYGAAFSMVEIYLNKKQWPYLIRLWRKLEPADSIDVNNFKYPPPVASIYDSLVSALGEPNQVIDEKPVEYANVLGIKQTIFWEGYHMSCRLYLDFGPNDGWHDMRLDISNGEAVPNPEMELE